MQDWERVRKTALAAARAQGLREDEAQDMAGEVTLRLLRGKSDPSTWRDFGAYVRAATDHEVGRYRATKRRREAREVRQARELASTAPSPEEMAGATMQYAEVLTHLDETERKLLGLVAIGMTSKQVGRLLGISAEAARKRLQRVREAIRLTGEGDGS